MEPHPEPPRPIEPRGFFTGVRIRPIIVGAVIDYVATYLLIMLYLIAYHVKDVSRAGGVPEEEIERAMQEALSTHEGMLALIAIGALGTALGGYVAGRLAKSDEIKHGALVGAVSLIIGALHGGMGEGGAVPYWYEILAFLLAVPAGALGGSFAQGQSKISLPGGARENPP